MHGFNMFGGEYDKKGKCCDMKWKYSVLAEEYLFHDEVFKVLFIVQVIFLCVWIAKAYFQNQMS